MKASISSVLLLGLAAYGAQGTAATLDVNCSGGGDRAAIQAAIDLAQANDVVHIHGACQFDGERVVIDKSNLTLRGDASDSDGDGVTDQWGTVLYGNGNVDDLLAGPYTNLGLHVGAVPAADEDIVGVTIEGLQLQDFYLALTVAPGVLAEDNLHCDALQVTGAKASRVEIRNNRFVDNSNHFFLYGAAENVRYDDNRSEGGGGIPLASATFVLGKRTICLADPDTGATGSRTIGTSDNFKLTNSHFEGVAAGLGTSDVELVNATNSSIEGNSFDGDAQPVFLFGAIETRVQDNVILDSETDAVVLLNAQDTVMSGNFILGPGWTGLFTLELPPTHPVVQILGLPPSLDNRIHCNHVEGTGTEAMIVIDGTNQFARNRFAGNPLDILLLAPGNKVVAGPNDSVVDASGGNDVSYSGKESRCAPEF